MCVVLNWNIEKIKYNSASTIKRYSNIKLAKTKNDLLLKQAEI